MSCIGCPFTVTTAPEPLRPARPERVYYEFLNRPFGARCVAGQARPGGPLIWAGCAQKKCQMRKPKPVGGVEHP